MKALDYATLIIEHYELDIKDAKKEFGVNLVKMGFCQGIIYKKALETIKRKRNEEEALIKSK